MPRLVRLLPVLLLLALPAAAPAAGVEFVRVISGWRDAASFQRVSEYFGGRENTGGMIVLRMRPGERAGFYWLVRLKNDGAPVPGAKFELQVITPAAPEPKTFTFAAAVPAGSALYELGLTGADWPDAKARPAAWRLRLLAADGHTLIGEQSFLWELPGKP
jgi:hypothetical protein